MPTINEKEARAFAELIAPSVKAYIRAHADEYAAFLRELAARPNENGAAASETCAQVTRAAILPPR